MLRTNPGDCGHGMGGAPIALRRRPRWPVYAAAGPFPPAKLSVFVFEDDFPLNGEQDGGGGIDVLSPNEPGLGGFNITLFDDAGGTGDATGQMTYDMFNQPLVNSLAGTIDPVTGKDACPVSAIPRTGTNADGSYDKTQTGITGTIVTCPKYESDGVTLSPLAGQAVVANLMPGRYGVVATPGADRIAPRRGVAADQYARRPEGARLLPAHRRAELLPGIRSGRISRVDRLRQPGDHQWPQGGGLQRHPTPSSRAPTATTRSPAW